ncbi:hypothetical protein BABINDRAFT_77706 [Babjeviella inositovora NRRL Y-12698]|uniref:Uncharacterized protein n=1 Tax=Babjeviella inositovora NRRL Y-12698 TaxID=984486 RepID=A0A1E3QZ21_9ASCO|nr:uncharacterized protein BABINDRAFT_77706 [Babjeviella inositovora NRRL Y-12698]ODQ82871.1 hypothetical protein BABINDRAFT_77706 [Babjeviella inositovora NRRL Y-12698]
MLSSRGTAVRSSTFPASPGVYYKIPRQPKLPISRPYWGYNRNIKSPWEFILTINRITKNHRKC